MSTNLKNLLSLYANSLPRVANSFAPLPTPYTKGVIKTPSDENLTLFNSLRRAYPLFVASGSLSTFVGPPSISPKVPIFSMSATKASPAAPPITPAANLL